MNPWLYLFGGTLPDDRMYQFNLDWFLKRFTELSLEWDETKAAWLALKEYVENFFNELDVQEEINNKLDAMIEDGTFREVVLPIVQTYATPQIVQSVSEMTNPNKIYVLQSNGHVYDYEGGQFVDTGIVWGSAQNAVVALKRFYSNQTAQAPFDNVDTFPSNSVVSFSDANATGISNAPLNQGVTLTVAGGSSSDPFNSQYFISYSGGTPTMFYRCSNGTTWSKWGRLKNALSQGRYIDATASENPPAPYDDFNTIPQGEVICYNHTQNVDNAPVGGSGCLTYTLMSDTGNAKTQICVKSNGEMLTRTMWGGVWREWRSTGGLQYLNHVSIANPYPTLDDVPLNRFWINSHVEAISEGENPEITTNGSIMTYGGDDYQYAKVMEAKSVRTGMFAYRGTWTAQPGKNWGIWYPWHYVYNDVPNGGLSVYNKIGVIGDSFAHGSIYDSDNQSLGSTENYAWINILAKKCGVPFTGRYTFGGAYCKTWLTDSRGKTAFDNDAIPCDLLFMALGINDSNQTDEQPLGTAADIGTNTNSFYGNYSRIIELVMQKNANTRILCLGVGRFNATYNETTNAIEEIANHYEIPFIDQWRDTYFACSQYDAEKYGNHPTAVGYNSMARAIERLYNLAVVTHTEYFKNLPLELPSSKAKYRNYSDYLPGDILYWFGSANLTYQIKSVYVVNKKTAYFSVELSKNLPAGATINDINCERITHISLIGNNGSIYYSDNSDDTLVLSCERIVSYHTLVLKIEKADGTNFNDTINNAWGGTLIVRRVFISYEPQT